MPERKNSEARIKANNKYNAKAYDRINLAVQKGKKDILQAHAQIKGESLNGFVNRAINEALERDNSVSQSATPAKPQPAAEPPKTKTINKRPSSITAFTPDARKAVDLKLLLSNLRYQLDIQAMYGMDVLSDLLDEAKSIQEPDTPVTGE